MQHKLHCNCSTKFIVAVFYFITGQAHRGTCTHMHTQKVKSDYKVVDISKITKKRPQKIHDRKQKI